MYRKCNINITEHYEAFQTIFNKIKNKTKLTYTYNLHANRQLPKLNKQSTIGTKIKYYRRLANIKQEDLASKLNVSRDSIMAIENRKKYFYDVELLNRVVDILDIRDKLKKSNTYEGFILNNPSEQIKSYRLENKLSRNELASKLNVYYSTVLLWEKGRILMNKDNYIKFSKLKK